MIYNSDRNIFLCGRGLWLSRSFDETFLFPYFNWSQIFKLLNFKSVLNTFPSFWQTTCGFISWLVDSNGRLTAQHNFNYAFMARIWRLGIVKKRSCKPKRKLKWLPSFFFFFLCRWVQGGFNSSDSLNNIGSLHGGKWNTCSAATEQFP